MSESLAAALYGPQSNTPAVAQSQQPSDLGSALYGSTAPAPARERPVERDSTAASIYSGGRQAEPTSIRDGSVHSNLAGHLEAMIERGEVERSDAFAIGRTLTSEAQAIGLGGSNGDAMFRDLNVAAGPESQRDRADAVAALREEYGAQAEAKLAAGLKVLRERAPNLAQALASSKAGNSREMALYVARLGERARSR